MNNIPSAPLIAAEEVRSNFIKSFFLVGIIVALVFALSYYIGYLLGDIRTGLLVGAGISLVLIPLQIMTAKWMILAMTSGRKANPDNLRERRASHCRRSGGFRRIEAHSGTLYHSEPYSQCVCFRHG